MAVENLHGSHLAPPETRKLNQTPGRNAATPWTYPSFSLGDSCAAYRTTTKQDDIQRLRKRLQSIATEAVEADNAGKIDRPRFNGLEAAAKYRIERNLAKRSTMLVNRLEDLTRIWAHDWTLGHDTYESGCQVRG